MRQKRAKQLRKLVRNAGGDRTLERKIKKLWASTPDKDRQAIINVLLNIKNEDSNI